MTDDKPTAYIPQESWGACRICKKWQDRRGGVCFDCATAAEERAIAAGKMIREVTDD